MRKIQLLSVVFAAAMVLAPGAWAVDTQVSKDAPDLTAVRAKIKALDFAGAIVDLKKLTDTHDHADVFNLLGFSMRKSGDMKGATLYYAKALDYDPEHKGALEYQGEMFVQLGQMEKAKANLVKLVKLCPTGCEEREDLEKAIADAEKSPKPASK